MRHRRIAWWLFDRTPTRFQDWVESWARTLIVRRNRMFLPDDDEEQDDDFWIPDAR
jgi:hypothetical protein